MSSKTFRSTRKKFPGRYPAPFGMWKDAAGTVRNAGTAGNTAAVRPGGRIALCAGGGGEVHYVCNNGCGHDETGMNPLIEHMLEAHGGGGCGTWYEEVWM